MSRYTDGRPVIHGPFGGDDPQPWELRILASIRRREARRRRWLLALALCAVSLAALVVGVLL